MAKTQEELNQLKTEYETLNNKLKELTDDELIQVTGGEHQVNKPGTDFVLAESEDFTLEETLTK